MEKRPVDVVVISDVHLGTYGCRAKELVNYLRSITPNMLILNGDIIDGWQFTKRYFPVAHVMVIKEIIQLITNGIGRKGRAISPAGGWSVVARIARS